MYFMILGFEPMTFKSHYHLMRTLAINILLLQLHIFYNTVPRLEISKIN